MRIRDATREDAGAIAAIGSVEFVRLHQPLMGTVATDAVIEQIYTEAAVAASIKRCKDAGDAHFLVAVREECVVGFLHFDNFGTQAELHRRLGADDSYILLVAVANERARGFYARHGLVEERLVVDCNALYGQNMGVEFPPEADPVPAIVMRWRGRSDPPP